MADWLDVNDEEEVDGSVSQNSSPSFGNSAGSFAGLRIQAEEREIKGQLRADRLEQLQICTSTATRPRDIQRALLDSKPEIVHFSGHGEGADGLVLEDDSGDPRLVSSDALADLFRTFTYRYPIECVVLNACYSEIQAREIAKWVDYVIGMKGEIGDKAAIEFSIGFYRGLSSGESYEFSYRLGCNAIHLVGLPEFVTPVFLKPAEGSEGIEEVGRLRADDELKIAGLTKLESLLRMGWWKEADRETTTVLLRLVGREEGDWVRDRELEELPCAVLRHVDALWSRSSDGKFGFSAQRSIWQKLGGIGTQPRGDGDLERKFGDIVGWRKNEEWLGYHSYTFDISAPRGHLPRDYCRHVSGWWLGRSCLISTRLVICDAAPDPAAAKVR